MLSKAASPDLSGKSRNSGKKLKIGLVFLLVMAGIVFVLINNKSKLEAKTNNNIIDTYSVTIEKVGKKEISKSLELIGTITGSNDVAVVAEASGRVTGVQSALFGILIKIRDLGLPLISLEKVEETNKEREKDIIRT